MATTMRSPRRLSDSAGRGREGAGSGWLSARGAWGRVFAAWRALVLVAPRAAPLAAPGSARLGRPQVPCEAAIRSLASLAAVRRP